VRESWEDGEGWCERRKSIGGGVPICFPWFGPRSDGGQGPAHGFARLSMWNLDSTSDDSSGNVTVSMFLKAGPETQKFWPHDFLARHIVTIGPSLEMKLEVQNTSQESIRFDEALHTYFGVGDIKQ